MMIANLFRRLTRFMFEPLRTYKAQGRFEYPGGRVIDVDQLVMARTVENAFLDVYRPLVNPEAPTLFRLHVWPDDVRDPSMLLEVEGSE